MSNGKRGRVTRFTSKMRNIKDFWIACLNCKEKSLVNIAFDQINYIATFHCYNCNKAEVLYLAGTEPPIDKEDFKNKAKRLKRPAN